MNRKKLILTSTALLFIFYIVVLARGFRVAEIPNGSVNNCANCHVNPGGGGPRDDFGKLVGSRFLTQSGSAGHVNWNALLASLDADNDGVTNGEELQDSFGEWVVGSPGPGNSVLVTDPSDPNDDSFFNLTISFSGMTPHIGQQLELRVIDKATGLESGREEVSAIPGANFDVDLRSILSGHSYIIDFFADHNLNNLYDTPPTDHAWRMELNNVTGDTTLNFAHNTNFTDVEWKYMLEVDFTGMTPHIGQLLEMRVVDQNSNIEIGRKRVEFIPQVDFTLNIPGLELGADYRVDLYADLSGNFLYDVPPTDHAWRETFVNNSGDHIINFSHNTSFTDIMWTYQFRMNTLSMNPHVGQLFELRIVDDATLLEIGRVTVDNIPSPEFVMFVPGILPGNDYRADFYADLNGNGVYDPPPTDHAWRVIFTDSTGNSVINFTHNTNFTNIDWPTSIVREENPGIINSYTLSENFPNPFNPETKLKFTIPNSEFVNVEIFNISGQKVRTLVNDVLSKGEYTVSWNGTNDFGVKLSSGTYIYRLKTNNFVQYRRMILLK